MFYGNYTLPELSGFPSAMRDLAVGINIGVKKLQARRVFLCGVGSRSGVVLGGNRS
jgi:hypothetical protein